MEEDYYLDDTDYTKSPRPITEWLGEGVFLDNLDIAGRRSSILYLVGLLLATLPAWGGYIVNAGQANRAALLLLVFSLIAILVFWVLHKRFGARPRNWLSPDVVFVAAFFVFHFSYIVLYAFGLERYDAEVFWNPAKVLRAVFFCICCLVAFLVGYEITGRRYRNSDSYGRLIPIAPTAISISKFIIIVSIMFFWGTLLSVGLGNLLTDYETLIVVGGWGGGRFYRVAFNIGVVAVAMYCAASGLLHRKCMYGRIFAFITLAFIIGILLLGNRRGFIYFAIVPVIAFHYFQRRIKLRWLTVGVLALFFIMGVIAITRTVAVLDVKKATEAYKQRKPTEGGVTTGTFVSFGHSIKMVVVAMDAVPSQYPYWYGKSYVDSLWIVAPNIIPGRVRTSWSVQSISLWLNEIAFGGLRGRGATHGRGGSIAMEAYLNFGFIGGVISFILLGGFYRFLYERFLAKPNFVRIVVLLAAMSALMLWVRDNCGTYTRTIVWALLASWTIQKLFQPSEYENLEYADTEVYSETTDVRA